MSEDIARRRDEVIAKWGPWIGYNIRLADDVYTINPTRFAAAERRVARVAQIVADVRGPSLQGTRVLDLGSHEGGFGIELALRGADVVCLEGRDTHVAKTRFAKECLGLSSLEIVQDDARNLGRAGLGRFDVVLCLGLLYHLPAGDLEPFLRSVAAACDGFSIVETQIATRPVQSFDVDGRRYAGRPYAEDPKQFGAALDATDSFWLTRASLLNMLGQVGFTSVAEVLVPFVLDVAEFEDHTALVAFKGQPVAPMSAPAVDESSREPWPERLNRYRHPAQTWWSRLPIGSRIARKRLVRTIRSHERPR